MPYPDGSTAPNAAPTRADRAAETAHSLAESKRAALLAQANGIAHRAAFDWNIAVRRIAPDLWPSDPQFTLAELIDDTLKDYILPIPDPDTEAEDARIDAVLDYQEREDD